MERVQTPVLVNLHLWFCTASFLYLALMCVGLWGKPDWGEVTRLRLPVVVDQETRRWQPSAARLQHSRVCAATCRANVLRRAHRQRVLGKPSRWAMNQKWEAWLCFFFRKKKLHPSKWWSPTSGFPVWITLSSACIHVSWQSHPVLQYWVGFGTEVNFLLHPVFKCWL